MRIITLIDKTWVNIFYGSVTMPLKLEAEPVFKTHIRGHHFVESKAVQKGPRVIFFFFIAI